MNDKDNCIRVVLRTRPTPQFASKQIVLDAQESVNNKFILDDNNK